jgi:hypothetical protein
MTASPDESVDEDYDEAPTELDDTQEIPVDDYLPTEELTMPQGYDDGSDQA